MPAKRKSPAQLVRTSRPEQWIVLPAEGCKLKAPPWPLAKPSAAETALWKRLWAAPLACWWHEQRIEPSLVARYVQVALEKPSLAAVSTMERELGLTPSAMARLRLTVEAPEDPKPEEPDPYAELKRKRGAR